LLREVYICGAFEACLASQYGDVLKEILMPRRREEANVQKRDREYRCMAVPNTPVAQGQQRIIPIASPFASAITSHVLVASNFCYILCFVFTLICGLK
jgi:hypothetical protein